MSYSQYNIVTEGQLSTILSHMDIDFTLSIIDDIVSRRPNEYNFNTLNNIPAAFESNFKQLFIDYSFEKDSIEEKREMIYLAIIERVSKRHGFIFNYNQAQDLYSAAYYIYDFLISNFNKYLIRFFTNYITKEKNNLYESLNLIESKRNKDSSTVYNKKIYKNNKLALIAANLEYVIDTICTFDISYEEILNTVFDDQNIIRLLLNSLTPVYNFFDLIYKPLFTRTVKPLLITEIRLNLQQLMSNDTFINIIKTEDEEKSDDNDKEDVVEDV